MKFIVFILSFVLSTQALACREFRVDRSQQYAQADTVVVARISGIMIPALEDPIDRRDDNKALIIGGSADRVLRLSVIETRKGAPADVLTVNWKFCRDGAGGLGRLGQRVIAYGSIGGGWYLERDPDSMYPVSDP